MCAPIARRCDLAPMQTGQTGSLLSRRSHVTDQPLLLTIVQSRFALATLRAGEAGHRFGTAPGRSTHHSPYSAYSDRSTLSALLISEIGTSRQLGLPPSTDDQRQHAS